MATRAGDCAVVSKGESINKPVTQKEAWKNEFTKNDNKDLMWRCTIGKIESAASVPIYALGVILQTAKVIIKLQFLPAAEFIAWALDTKKVDAFTFAGVEKDVIMLGELFKNIFYSVLGASDIPTKDYRSLREAFISTAKIVVLGKTEQPMKESISICIKSLIEKGGLNTEGLFRVSGTLSTMQRIDTQCLNASMLADDKISVADVAGILKRILREMRVPLFANVMKDLLEIELDPSVDPVPQLKEAIGRLSPENKQILLELIDFLGKVVDNSEVNKMTASNLATVIMPNLVKEPESLKTNPLKIIEFGQHMTDIFAAMIENHNAILIRHR